jgi:alpha-D-ribose 1-methylphosphonate 5-triphosphate synthase subunit PhnH
MIPADALAGGFADPVFESQSVFRAVLAALSRPGRAVDCASTVVCPSPLSSGAAAIVATLVDASSALFLDPALAGGAVPAWITFQTGAPIVSDPEKAAFAVIGDPLAMPDFAAFAQGSAEYPDRSTTLILEVDRLEGGAELILKGPGIKDLARISPHPLPVDFPARMRANRALFPRGVDLLLVAGTRILGLPRSTRVEAA